MRYPRSLVSLVLVVLFNSAVRGQFTIYNTSNSGLPSNDVRCVDALSYGTVWIGTDHGLARFYNNDWLVWDEANSAIGDHDVIAVAGRNAGVVWAGTAHGLKYFNGMGWADVSSHLTAPRVTALLLSPTTGLLFVGTDVGGLNMFSDTTWLSAYDTSFLSGSINALDYSNDPIHPGTFIGTSTMLVRTGGGSWAVLNSGTNHLPSANITGLACTAGNPDTWVATSGGLALFSASSNHFQIYTASNSGLPSDSLTCVAALHYPVWIGHNGQGLTRFSGFTWATYTTANSNLPSNDIHGLSMDPSGTLWIATAAGLAKLDNDVGIQESPLPEMVTVWSYPDPAIPGIVHLSSNSASPITGIDVFTIDGRAMDITGRWKKAEQKLDMTGQPPGMYMLYVNIAGHTACCKLILS